MIRRTLFGLFWFAIFWVAIMSIGGGIAGALAGGHASSTDQTVQQGFDRGFQTGVVAGVRFRQQYGQWVFVAAAVITGAGVFFQVLPGTKR